MPVSSWLLTVGKKGVKEEHTYGGELCRTVTPPSASCESRILLVGDLERERGGLLAPHVAACNIVGRTAGVEPFGVCMFPP